MRKRTETVQDVAAAVAAIVALYLIVVLAYGVLGGRGVPECAHEGDVGCHWSADRQGNHQGTSYTDEGEK